MAIVKAMLVFALVGLMSCTVLLLVPESWSESTHEKLYVVFIVLMLGAPIVTLLLHLRRKWLRWTLLGFVGTIVILGGLLEFAQHLLVHFLR